MKQLRTTTNSIKAIDNSIAFMLLYKKGKRAAWYDESFVLLHVFTKKTQKTPQREIDQAKRNLADMEVRSEKNE